MEQSGGARVDSNIIPERLPFEARRPYALLTRHPFSPIHPARALSTSIPFAASGRIRSFAPLASPQSKLLIVGSMPGAESLRQRRYYANPHNIFWRLMGELAGVDPQLDYDRRCQQLIAAGIALWDVLESCERRGSLDSSIDRRSAEVNDFCGFFERHRQVDAVFCNGAASFDLFCRRVLPQLDPELRRRLYPGRLPSTSPAHAALSFAAKCDRWRQALEPLLQRHGQAAGHSRQPLIKGK